MIQSDYLCDDDQLLQMLHGECDAADSGPLMDHVESCTRCQNRIDELAANEFEWKKTVELLSTAKSDAPSFDLASLHHVTWTESMARRLLSDPSHPELLGRVGRYDVECLIGSGGMGVVFKAYDTELNRPVAVKLLAPYLASSAAARNRFAREARAAAAVVDDHVVPIHNVETKGDHPFLVMKYIAGGSLQQRLNQQGTLETCEVLRIGMQTAKGLAAAHAQGLIHRDVKPSNILLDEGVDRALLTDFGLARATDDASLTRSGFHPGTPHYMSPEQVRGEVIDARSDLFGLGCVMYALCTGHPPFRSETSYAVLRRITDDTPRPIRESNPSIPAWLEAIVMKLLSKSPDDRFESSEQVAGLLEECLAHIQQPTTTQLPTVVASLAIQNTQHSNTSNSRRNRPPIKKAIAIAAFAFSVLLAGVLIILELDKGKLKIESDADDIPIVILQNEDVVQRLTIDRTGTTIRLSAGRYRIEFDKSVTGFEIIDSSVVLKRGTTEVAKVTHAWRTPLDKTAHDASQSGGEKNLWEAVREFNNLHPSDAQGNTQQRLEIGEVYTCLQWMLANEELPDEVASLARSKILVRNPFLPKGWQLTGGSVRNRSTDGITETWEVYLATNGLCEPILIRKKALTPPKSLRRKPDFSVDKNGTKTLDEAIATFNKSCEEIEWQNQTYQGIWLGGKEMDPLTKNEVLAAIALFSATLEDKESDITTRKQLDFIARNHRIPDGATLKILTSFKTKIGNRFFIWTIQLILPTKTPEKANQTLTIRRHFVGADGNNPDTTNWGRVGKNGVQAGFRLIPSRKDYKIGDVVGVEFLYRKVAGEPIAVTLPGDFRYRIARAQCLRDDVQGKDTGKVIKTKIKREPLVVPGKKIQFCRALADEVDESVGTKLVLPPGKRSSLQFVVDNPTSDERLETGRSHYFRVPSIEPKHKLPLYTGHWYRHWGRHVPGHAEPAESTPDPTFVDPFQIGVSLAKADASRIPAYFAGGLKVTKVAPHSPAEAVGMEVGDILLKWDEHQIYGDNPSKPLKYKGPERTLQERLNELAKYNGHASSNMKFDLLDHRTGEALHVVPALGRLANGGPTKAAAIERLMHRKRARGLPLNVDDTEDEDKNLKINLKLPPGSIELQESDDASAALEARTLAAVTSVFNDGTRKVRNELFSPPIPDLTEDQMRQAMYETAKALRRGKKEYAAVALEQSADSGNLPKRLVFTGASGTHSETFRQITPSFLHHDNSQHATLIVLSKAELRYSRDGWSSPAWGDVHAPLDGTWQLESVDQYDAKLDDESFKAWKNRNSKWARISIVENSMMMGENKPAPFDFGIDYGAGALPQFQISNNEITYSGVLLGSAFTNGQTLTLAVDLSGRTTPKTFHTRNGKSTQLKYRLVSDEDSGTAKTNERQGSQADHPTASAN